MREALPPNESPQTSAQAAQCTNRLSVCYAG